jgi:hypothetical protein
VALQWPALHNRPGLPPTFLQSHIDRKARTLCSLYSLREYAVSSSEAEDHLHRSRLELILSNKNVDLAGDIGA